MLVADTYLFGGRQLEKFVIIHIIVIRVAMTDAENIARLTSLPTSTCVDIAALAASAGHSFD